MTQEQEFSRETMPPVTGVAAHADDVAVGDRPEDLEPEEDAERVVEVEEDEEHPGVAPV